MTKLDAQCVRSWVSLEKWLRIKHRQCPEIRDKTITKECSEDRGNHVAADQHLQGEVRAFTGRKRGFTPAAGREIVTEYH